MKEYRLTIIGGLPNADEYIFRVPDLGRSQDELEARIAVMGREPGVTYAASVTWSSCFTTK